MALPECERCGSRIWRRTGCEVWNCPIGSRNRAARERRERRARERRAEVRSPPPLAGYTTGACRLCRGPIPPGRRRYWCSQDCVDLWALATSPARARWQLWWELDRCRECDTRLATSATGEVDHTRPLWSLTDEERTQIRWWLPFNLQLLCVPCHRAKTKREARERASANRTNG